MIFKLLKSIRKTKSFLLLSFRIILRMIVRFPFPSTIAFWFALGIWRLLWFLYYRVSSFFPARISHGWLMSITWFIFLRVELCQSHDIMKMVPAGSRIIFWTTNMSNSNCINREAITKCLHSLSTNNTIIESLSKVEYIYHDCTSDLKFCWSSWTYKMLFRFLWKRW